MKTHLSLLALLALLLAACAEAPPQGTPPAKAEATPEIKSQKLKYLEGRTLKPQPTRPLNVRSRCTHRDAVGTRTRLDMQVKDAEVKNFSAEVTIPRRGTCRFDLKNFTQKEKLPQVVLAAKDNSGCSVRMWEQDSGKQRQVTIAFNTCRAACDGDTFDYLWPILVDAKTGRCT